MHENFRAGGTTPMIHRAKRYTTTSIVIIIS